MPMLNLWLLDEGIVSWNQSAVLLWHPQKTQKRKVMANAILGSFSFFMHNVWHLNRISCQGIQGSQVKPIWGYTIRWPWSRSELSPIFLFLFLLSDICWSWNTVSSGLGKGPELELLEVLEAQSFAAISSLPAITPPIGTSMIAQFYRNFLKCFSL